MIWLFYGKGRHVTQTNNGDRFAAWIDRTIKDFADNSPENSMGKGTNEKAWGEPRVAFSRGDDPLYEKLRRDIGNFYWTPWWIFNKAFPNLEVSPDKLTVISWVLPQTEATKADNREETRYPSERWARARIFGEAFNDQLRRHVIEVLLQSGIEAVAPVLYSLWNWKETISEWYGLASNWSERHAAYVSGLGTFGLCEGLISPLGKAVRYGSVVARISMPPTTRPYADHRAYCLFYSEGTCGKCIDRCPGGAVTQKGHDKAKCWDYIQKITEEHTKYFFQGASDSCGFCQTFVPCESEIPVDHPTKGIEDME